MKNLIFATGPGTASSSNLDYIKSVRWDTAEANLEFIVEPLVDITKQNEGYVPYCESHCRFKVSEQILLKSVDLAAELDVAHSKRLVDQLFIEFSLIVLGANSDVSIGCYVSNETLRDKLSWRTLVQKIRSMQHLAPRLFLEFTECDCLIDINDLSFQIAEVRALGCQCVINCHGVPNINAFCRKTVRWDFAKVDLNLFAHVHRNAAGWQQLEILEELSTNIATSIVACGIESRIQLDIATMFDFKYGQGSLLAPPVTKQIIEIGYEFGIKLIGAMLACGALIQQAGFAASFKARRPEGHLPQKFFIIHRATSIRDRVRALVAHKP